MKQIPIFLLVLLSFSAYSQKFNYSITASYNQAFIPEIKKDIPTASYASGYTTIILNSGIKESYSSKSGGKLSGNFSYSFNSRLFIEGGLQLNLVRYNKTSEMIDGEYDGLEYVPYGDIITDTSGLIIVSPNQILYEDQDKLGNTSALYTEIPIQIGYSFFNSKLKCKIGFTTSFLAYAEVYVFNTETNINYYNVAVEKDKTADGFKNMVWNGNVELEYLVYKNIGLNLNYSRSLNSIYDDEASIGNPNYNLFSLGITYNFLQNID
jgi:hypothetical protein